MSLYEVEITMMFRVNADSPQDAEDLALEYANERGVDSLHVDGLVAYSVNMDVTEVGE